MPRRDSLKRTNAARIYLETGNMAETARQVGVDRSTIQRWVNDPTFLIPKEPNVEELVSLVPKALRVLDEALEGKRVTSSQIRAAIEIARSSNALKTQTAVAEKQTLMDIIAALDSEDSSSVPD